MTTQVSNYGLNGNDLFNKNIYEISLNLSKNYNTELIQLPIDVFKIINKYIQIEHSDEIPSFKGYFYDHTKNKRIYTNNMFVISLMISQNKRRIYSYLLTLKIIVFMKTNIVVIQ